MAAVVTAPTAASIVERRGSIACMKSTIILTVVAARSTAARNAWRPRRSKTRRETRNAMSPASAPLTVAATLRRRAQKTPSSTSCPSKLMLKLTSDTKVAIRLRPRPARSTPSPSKINLRKSGDGTYSLIWRSSESTK